MIRHSSAATAAASLFTCPIDVRGDWHAPPRSADAVALRMREVCLAGVQLRSDRQPTGLWVEERNAGPPSIWLHDDPPRIAWIDVNVGERDWCRLAYQFGHELGHVLCNSWQPDAAPRPPCQWLEEALVETFSVRGLGLLAGSWARSPPFPGNAAFADSIRQYRADLLRKYDGYAAAQGAGDLSSWFRARRSALDAETGLTDKAGAAVPRLLAEVEPDQGLLEDYGALNRWPGRSGVPIKQYFQLWQASCKEIGSPGQLPVRLAAMLDLRIS